MPRPHRSSGFAALCALGACMPSTDHGTAKMGEVGYVPVLPEPWGQVSQEKDATPVDHEGADERVCKWVPRGCLHGVSVVGDVHVKSDDDLIALEGVSCIHGDLTIVGTALSHLDSLSSLARIDGEFIIAANPRLTNVDGIGDLDFVGLLEVTANAMLDEWTVNVAQAGTVYFIGNERLQSLRGLHALMAVEGAFEVAHHNSLLTLEGLRCLGAVGGDLRLRNNSRLRHLPPLEQLVFIGGTFLVEDNESLTGALSSPALVSIGDSLVIHSNPMLKRLALPRLARIERDLRVEQNAALRDLHGLSKLTRVGENIALSENPTLSSLRGLEGVKELSGSLSLQANDTLIDLEGIRIRWLGGSLELSDNAAMESLHGLERLERIDGHLYLFAHPRLRNAEGVAHIVEVGGEVHVRWNLALENLSLRGLRGALMNLGIGSNPSLRSVDLPGLESVEGKLDISDAESCEKLSFPALRYVGRELRVRAAHVLPSVEFPNLEWIQGDLSIFENLKLRRLHLPALQKIAAWLSVYDNISLPASEANVLIDQVRHQGGLGEACLSSLGESCAPFVEGNLP